MCIFISDKILRCDDINGNMAIEGTNKEIEKKHLCMAHPFSNFTSLQVKRDPWLDFELDTIPGSANQARSLTHKIPS